MGGAAGAATTGLGWMAWTWQTATFFGVIGLLLVGMMVWEWRRPGGAPRRGVLRLVTTRGDRLFISLLSAAYVHLAWLAFLSAPLWGATVAAVLLAVLVFRYV
jgi:predicted small integral membrane protein